MEVFINFVKLFGSTFIGVFGVGVSIFIYGVMNGGVYQPINSAITAFLPLVGSVFWFNEALKYAKLIKP
jgi:hypothetical protein